MIVIEKWQGLVTNASPYVLPAGAFVKQENMQCIRPGQIESRRGYAPVGSAVTGTIISSIQFRDGQMVCQSSDGSLHIVTVS